MKRLFSIGPKLITGLMLLLIAGALMAENTIPAAYVKPGIDLSIYTKVMIKPLNMDNIEVLKPVWEQDNDEEWSFNPEDRTAIQEYPPGFAAFRQGHGEVLLAVIDHRVGGRSDEFALGIQKADEGGILVTPFVERNRLEYIRLLDFGLGGILPLPETRASDGAGHGKGVRTRKQ